MIAHKRFILLVVASLLLLPSLCLSQKENEFAGMSGRINPEGLEAVKHVLMDIIRSRIAIPDIAGEVYSINYKFTGVNVDRFDIRDTSLVTESPNLVTAEVSDAGITVTGNFFISKLVNFIFFTQTISDEGVFKATISGLTASQQIRLGEDGQGQPTITAGLCRASVQRLSIKLKGSFISSLIEAGLKLIKGVIRNKFVELICPSVQYLITEMNSRIKVFDATFALPLSTSIDFSLVRPPTVDSNTIEVGVSGRCFSTNHPEKRYNVSKTPMSPLSQSRRMFQAGISDYAINTYLASAVRHEFFERQFEEHQVRDAINFDLSVRTLSYIDPALIPHVEKPLRYLTRFTSPPTAVLSQNSIGLSGDYELVAQVIADNQTFIDALTIRLSISALGGVNINESVIFGRFGELNITVVESGNFPPDFVQSLVDSLLETSIIPAIHEILETGIPIPSIYNFSLRNVELQMKENSIEIATDIHSAGSW